MKKKNRAVEGLRGYAILLILLSHTNILLQGAVGNAIFFGLSGFFAASPFRERGVEEKFAALRGIWHFYSSKLWRILPVYWVCLGAIQFFDGSWFADFSAFLRCLFFIDSYRHLWFLQNTMVFYLLTPPVMLLLLGLRKAVRRLRPGDLRGELAACVIFLIVFALLWEYFGTIDRIYVLQQGKRIQIHFHQYLLGMSFAYLYRLLLLPAPPRSRSLFAAVPLMFVLFTIFSSARIIRLVHPGKAFLIGQRLPLLCTSAACLTVLSLLLCPDSVSARLFDSFPLRFLGKISFSLYILHLSFVQIIQCADRYRTFAAVAMASIAAAILAYYLLERPSAVYASTRSPRAVLDSYRELFRFLDD